MTLALALLQNGPEFPAAARSRHTERAQSDIPTASDRTQSALAAAYCHAIVIDFEHTVHE